MGEWKTRRRRRGLPRQRTRLRCERAVRVATVALSRWCRRRGIHREEVARRIGLPVSTLRRWEREWRRNRLGLHPRGRPPEQIDGDLRRAIMATMWIMGPETGLPTLRSLFPHVARGELQELQRHGRHLFRRRRKWLVHMLTWTRAGSVWSMDFSDPPAPIDGIYRKVLCVRDLASGKQLMALPCLDKSAKVTVSTLEALARWCGVPLVLKCDNEGAFRSDELKAWARLHGVLVLYSPEGTPEYNGSIEAGIGSIKTRAHYEAVRQGRPGEWTCDDVEAAIQQANTTARPRGQYGPTPVEMWNDRTPLGSAEREEFNRSYRRYFGRECHARGIAWGVSLQHGEQASIDRVAISRALIDHGFLLIRRKRVSLPNSHRKACIIS